MYSFPLSFLWACVVEFLSAWHLCLLFKFLKHICWLDIWFVLTGFLHFKYGILLVSVAGTSSMHCCSHMWDGFFPSWGSALINSQGCHLPSYRFWVNGWSLLSFLNVQVSIFIKFGMILSSTMLPFILLASHTTVALKLCACVTQLCHCKKLTFLGWYKQASTYPREGTDDRPKSTLAHCWIY